MSGITLRAIFNKATTTVDGGWNITFSVNQDEAAQVLQLSEFRDTELQLGILPVDYIKDVDITGEVDL